MKKFLSAFCILVYCSLPIMGCKKNKAPECETWRVTYYQGRGDGTTVTTNYYPYSRDERICGAGKDTVVRNKKILLSLAGSNLYNYKYFEVKVP